MKGVVLRRAGDIAVCEFPEPKLEPGWALLELLYGGICGSDLGSYRGKFSYCTYPRIPGHEFSARIIRMEGRAPNLREGDIVTCNPYFNCGVCHSCRRGRVNACMENQTMGVQRDGAFVQYLSMPLERIYPGEGLDAQTLALIEPFCIGYHGVRRAATGAGDKVLVFGAGAIGTLAALAAKIQGAQVWITDLVPEKVEQAVQAFSLDGGFVNTSPEDLARQVRLITGTRRGGANGFDVTVEATGQSRCFADCVEAAAFGGRVVEIGVPQQRVELAHQMLQKKELSVFGSRNATAEDFAAVIRQVRQEQIPLKRIVSRIYPLEQAAQAFADLDSGNGALLKVLIDFTHHLS